MKQPPSNEKTPEAGGKPRLDRTEKEQPFDASRNDLTENAMVGATSMSLKPGRGCFWQTIRP